MTDLKNAEEFKRWRTECRIIFPSENQAKQGSSMVLGRLAETNGFGSFAAQKNERPCQEGGKKVMGNDETTRNYAAWKVIQVT